MAVLSEIDSVMEEILTAKEDDIISFWDASQPRSLLALICCVVHNSDEQSVLNALGLLGNLVSGLDWYNLTSE